MAARYLCTHDYTILARNYRTPFGEVDLIAQKDGVLVYVEVKYRSSNDYGDPLEAVDRRKQRQICKVANYHYAGYAAGQEMDCRFDVIGIYEPGEPDVHIRTDSTQNVGAACKRRTVCVYQQKGTGAGRKGSDCFFASGSGSSGKYGCFGPDERT